MSNPASPNPVSAVDLFAAHLAFQTDAADLAADRAAGRSPLVLDVGSDAAWAQGHLPGAVHLPGRQVRERLAQVSPDRDAPVVVHCWGPGCDGATRAALVLATLGCTGVRELVGGYEYGVREGFAVVTAQGRVRRSPDPLAAPVPPAETPCALGTQRYYLPVVSDSEYRDDAR